MIKRILLGTLFLALLAIGSYKAYFIMKVNSHQKNHLAKEQSPYLLQHKDNPIWWYTWGKEALAAAKEQDKPIFLSIGYSTCHWCHVMEHESFETQEVADVLNKSFISIKVDREERPDVDGLYMNAVQLITGRGGWPLSAWLTPDGKPFYGGTYFPKLQFIAVLNKISIAWEKDRTALVNQGQQLKEHIEKLNNRQAPLTSLQLKDEIFGQYYQQMQSRFDPSNGGFGAAPKFPQTMSLMALMRIARRNKTYEAETMVRKTLEEMSRRGMYDHLNGGFHRYSTDANWLVPHFEKMLYDNALLSLTLLEAHQVNPNSEYEFVIKDTLDYILREMTHAQGGFYSAQDADSLDPSSGHKEEGIFAIWSYKELATLLSPGELTSLQQIFDISEQGNFEGKNILTLKESVTSPEKQKISKILDKMRLVRQARNQPHLDDKVIVAWNGLMIGALARASSILKDKKYYIAAKKALEFILENFIKSDGLRRRWRNGDARYAAYSDDYALLIFALIEMYQVDFQTQWLDHATKLQKEMDEKFWDQKSYSYFRDDGSDKNLIIRLKGDHDGVRPSSNSVALLNLLRLHDLTYDRQYLERAENIFNSFSELLQKSPASLPYMLAAFDYYSDHSKEIAVVGDAESPKTQNIVEKLSEGFVPNKVIAVGIEGPPLLKNKTQINNLPTIYICENRTCKLPTTDVVKALELMSGFKSLQ